MATSALKTPPETSRPPAGTRLSAFAVHGRVERATLERAVPVLLDTLAVTVAGGAEPGVVALARSLAPHPGTDGVPSFWTDASHRADDAALLFGMASHVLDYDDVSMLTVCHPSTPILSALLAVAPRDRTGDADFLDAFVIGTEVLIRLGQAMGFRHYALGFHATATLGAVGAAAASARILGLDETRTRHALSIAASLSSGLRVNFGSMVKSLHVGIAAANGLKAARLAAAGIEGATEALEGEGFLHAFTGGETTSWPAGLELGQPFAIDEPGFEQKRYPCCYMLHKMIEATLLLRRETGLALDDIAAVRVDMPQGGTKPLIHPYPANGLNALFSGPYAVAASLADGRIDLASFTDAAVIRPAIQARLRDIAVVETGAPLRNGGDVGGAPVTVTLTPRAGGQVSRTVVLSPGSMRDPITPGQLRRKWDDCLRRARPGLDDRGLGALFDEGRAVLDAASVAPWLGRVAAALRTGH